MLSPQISFAVHVRSSIHSYMSLKVVSLLSATLHVQHKISVLCVVVYFLPIVLIGNSLIAVIVPAWPLSSFWEVYGALPEGLGFLLHLSLPNVFSTNQNFVVKWVEKSKLPLRANSQDIVFCRKTLTKWALITNAASLHKKPLIGCSRVSSMCSV